MLSTLNKMDQLSVNFPFLSSLKKGIPFRRHSEKP